MSMVHFLPWTFRLRLCTTRVRQEQIAAEQERVERVQQRTVEQIVHVPVPQIQEQSAEGADQALENIVKDNPRLPLGRL